MSRSLDVPTLARAALWWLGARSPEVWRAPPASRVDAIAASGLVVLGTVFGSWAWLTARGGAPTISDEFVYLFQAKTFLLGRIAMPSPPLPEFFESPHVLVLPVFAAKYMPVHAALLAPFVALGVPWLGPCLVFGISSALIFLTLRSEGYIRPVAAVAGLLFLGSPENCRWSLTYLSQSTSTLWMVASALLVSRFRKRMTPIAAAALGTVAVLAVATRPFTGLAILAAASLTICLARARVPSLAAFTASVVMGAVAVSAYCFKITGSWTTTPWGLYAQQYTPFDGPGIGAIEDRVPFRGLPPHLAPMAEAFRQSRERHTLKRLPEIARQRWEDALSFSPAPAVSLLSLVGLLALPAGAVFPLLSAMLLFAVSLTFHWSGACYSMDTYPAVLVAFAGGLQTSLSLLLRVRRRRARGLAVALFVSFAAAWYLASAGPELLYNVPGYSQMSASYFQRVDLDLAQVREERGVVFLKYSNSPVDQDFNRDLTLNEPDLGQAAMIRAIDFGNRNDELLRLFPGRPAFRYDVHEKRLSRLPKGSP